MNQPRFLHSFVPFVLLLIGGSSCISIATYERQIKECRDLQSRHTETSSRLSASEKALDRCQETLENKESEYSSLQKTQDDLKRELDNELKAGTVGIETEGKNLKITVGDKVLFHSGRSTLQPGGETLLKKVAEIIGPTPDKKIHVEGHTDNIPIAGSLKQLFPSNWDLSAARASSVIRYLEESGVPHDQLVLVAHSDTQPVGSNQSVSGRRKNRRVEIYLVPDKP